MFMQAVKYFPMMIRLNHITGEAVMAQSPHAQVLAYLYWFLQLAEQLEDTSEAVD